MRPTPILRSGVELAPGAGVPLDPDRWSVRGGLLVPSKRRPVAMDFFCGCGGFSLGVIDAGFEVVAALDADPWASLTYMINLGAYPMDIRFAADADRAGFEKVVEKQMRLGGKGKIAAGVVSGSARRPGTPPVGHFFMGDVRQFTGRDILDACGLKVGEVDLIVGGPPCQGFSRANSKRNVMDPRNSLVFEFARLVLEIRPRNLCMENVPDIAGMVTPEGFPVLDEFCRILQDGGFGTVEALKRSFAHTSGAGAAILGKPERGIGRRNARKEKPAKKAAKQPEQVALL